MKYEIIKGSEKDFEGSPEWATLVVSGELFGRKFYLEGAEKGLKYKPVDMDCVNTINDIHIKSTIIAERRPITEPAWLGEGLPPVGVECEIFITSNKEWVPVEIFAHHKGVVYGMASGRLIANSEYESDFRPIRSPEDVARHNALYSLEALHIDSDVTVKIYDAIAAGKIPGITLVAKPAKQSDSECEHKNTHPTSGGCACNDCGWTSW